MNINNEKLIYFYSPNGTWTRINKNLEYLGLDKNKKIANTYARHFSLEVLNNTYLDRYKEYDVIYLDEFYDFVFRSSDCFKNAFDAIKKLIEVGKQIVMAGHEKIEDLRWLPDDMKKEVALYDLKYDLDWDYNYKVNYIDYD